MPLDVVNGNEGNRKAQGEPLPFRQSDQKRPDQPWASLQRLALMVCERVGAAPTRRPAPAGLRLALAP